MGVKLIEERSLGGSLGVAVLKDKMVSTYTCSPTSNVNIARLNISSLRNEIQVIEIHKKVQHWRWSAGMIENDLCVFVVDVL